MSDSEQLELQVVEVLHTSITGKTSLKDQALAATNMDLLPSSSSNSGNETPAHKLTGDVLAYIFFLNATSPDASCGDRAAATTASSQVCTRWRLLAMGYPMIWGCIIDYSRYSLKWIDVLLHRSDPSPLDFGSRIRPISSMNRRKSDKELSMLKLVFNHISRLRVFNLQAPVSRWELVRSRFFRQPAPNLEFMKFAVIFGTGCVLTDPVFNGYAPRLQNLQLHRFAIDFSSPILTRLTEIYVHDITELNAAPTVLGWLNILGGMPSLQWITIIHALSDATTHTALPVMHLDNLEILSIEGGFHETVTLIDHLISPLRCSLRLRCDDAQMGFDQRTLWAIFKMKMDSWEKDAPNRCLDVVQSNGSITIGNDQNPIVLWDTEAGAAHHKRFRPLDPILAVTLRSPNYQEIFSLFLQLFGIFEQTFFNTITLRLWINDPNDCMEVFLPLISSFSSFENLSTLYLTCDSHSFFFPLLQQNLPSGSALLPSLHTVGFIGVDFRPISVSLAPVSAFLQWRREQGFPIHKLNIIESCLDRDNIQSQLRDVCVEVDMEDCSNYSDSEMEDSD